MEKFRGVDYYGIDELLTEEQRMMRDAVRDWVEAKFLPIVGPHHRAGTFPMELAKDLGEMGGYLVEKGTPGFGTLDIHGKFSMRASITSELSFQDCRIPVDNKLPGVKGLKGPLGCLSQARYGIAWGAIGAAMACYDWALQYAQQRIQFGKPIGSFQLVQQKLVWMVTEMTKAQLLCLRLGQLKDAGKARPQQISMAKMNNVQMALEAARMGRDILGAAGR